MVHRSGPDRRRDGLPWRGENWPQSAAMHSEAVGLMEANEDPWGLATAWEGLGVAQLYQRDTDGAADSFEKSLASNPQAFDKTSIATALLGACRLGHDDDDSEALRLIDEGAAVIFRRRDWVGRAFLMAGVIPALVKRGHLDSARSIIEQELVIARSSGDLRGRADRSALPPASSRGSARRCGPAAWPEKYSRSGSSWGRTVSWPLLSWWSAKFWWLRARASRPLACGERPSRSSTAWRTSDHPSIETATNELREKLVLSLEASDLDREIEAGEESRP